jgi:hypothetical protein
MKDKLNMSFTIHVQEKAIHVPSVYSPSSLEENAAQTAEILILVREKY